MKNNIIEYTVSKTTQEFVHKGINASIDTIAEILSECNDIPYVSNLYKMGKFVGGIKEFFFVRRLARFLSYSDSIPLDKKYEFVNGITPKEKEKISEFLLHILYNSNESIKSDVYGLIYKRRILSGFERVATLTKESDNEILLRLCHGVDSLYGENLRFLPYYLSEQENDDVSSEDLLRAGFLKARGKPTRSIPYIPVNLYSLTPLGEELLDILNDADWFAKYNKL